ncbi:MAG: hypothetical protein V8T46_13185 [Sutterella seckii]
MRPYLEIVEEEGVKKVVVKKQKWQEALEAKGFYAIASSEDMTADEIDERYDRRDASEKQFMILKKQLGFHTTRVTATRALKANSPLPLSQPSFARKCSISASGSVLT